MTGELIKRFREDALKLTQQDFAREVGASTSTVGNWEKGYVIKPDWLPALAATARRHGQDRYAEAFDALYAGSKVKPTDEMAAKLDEILLLVQQLVARLLPERPSDKK